MNSARFLLQDILEKIRFFEKTFLLANTSMGVSLKMLFLSFINANVDFAKQEKLTQRSYTTTKALLTTSQAKLINKRVFAKTVLDENSKTFVIHVIVLEFTEIVNLVIYPLHTTQIVEL